MEHGKIFGELVSTFVALVVFSFAMLYMSDYDYGFFSLLAFSLGAIILGLKSGRVGISGVPSFVFGFIFGIVCNMLIVIRAFALNIVTNEILIAVISLCLLSGFVSLLFAGLTYIAKKYTVI